MRGNGLTALCGGLREGRSAVIRRPRSVRESPIAAPRITFILQCLDGDHQSCHPHGHPAGAEAGHPSRRQRAGIPPRREERHRERVPASPSTPLN
eukprot:gene12072-biopygen4312